MRNPTRGEVEWNQYQGLLSTGLLRNHHQSGGGGDELLMQQGWCALQPPCGQCGAHKKISKNQMMQEP